MVLVGARLPLVDDAVPEVEDASVPVSATESTSRPVIAVNRFADRVASVSVDRCRPRGTAGAVGSDGVVLLVTAQTIEKPSAARSARPAGRTHRTVRGVPAERTAFSH